MPRRQVIPPGTGAGSHTPLNTEMLRRSSSEGSSPVHKWDFFWGEVYILHSRKNRRSRRLSTAKCVCYRIGTSPEM